MQYPGPAQRTAGADTLISTASGQSRGESVPKTAPDGHRTAVCGLDPSAYPPSTDELVAEFLKGLTARGMPCFEVPPESISVLHSPHDFHKALVEGVARAKERVCISTLYLGTGDVERSFAEALASSAHRETRRTHILLDKYRGTRQDAAGASSLSVLASSLSCQPRTTVSLLSPPQPDELRTRFLSAVADALLPRSIASLMREIIGVHHVKMAIFDDDLILTGANLATDYLTSRQDRYILVRGARQTSDFLEEVLELLSSHLGTQLVPPRDADRSRPTRAIDAEDLHAAEAHGWKVHRSPKAESAALRDALRNLNASWQKKATDVTRGSRARLSGCWLLPTTQIGSAGWKQESEAGSWLLHRAQSIGQMPVMLSSPYLNLQPALADSLLKAEAGTPPPVLLTSAPQASSFWGARGARGLVPYLYDALEARLLCKARASDFLLQLRHYLAAGTTFHAKGLWLWPPGTPGPIPLGREGLGTPHAPFRGTAAPRDVPRPCGPFLTAVGSSNYGLRSANRDIELSAFLLTTDERVHSALHAETQRLLLHTQPPASLRRSLSRTIAWCVRPLLQPFL